MEGHIIMSQKELGRLKTIQHILDRQISQKAGAKIIGISYRQVKRLLKRIKTEGIKSITHRSRGRPSQKKIPDSVKDRVLKLYKEKYTDFGPTFALEKLKQFHDISMSRETLRKLLIDAELWHGKKRRESDLHVWRERKHYEGEMIQIDGSHHRWLEDRLDQEFCLMAFCDDATGKIFARFYEYEGVFPILDSFMRYAQFTGFPHSVYIDRHSTYKTTRKASVDDDLHSSKSNTQFQQVMKSIGVQVIFARSPQAKGRVERIFETLQDRLVKEMRLAGITSIPDANLFLEQYLPIFNKQFAHLAKEKTKLFKKPGKDFDYQWTFCLSAKRIIAKDFTIRCFNRLFIIKHPYLSLKGQHVLIKQALNGLLRFETKHKILSVKEITDMDLNLVKQAQIQLKKQLRKKPASYKSKKSWMDNFYIGKRSVHLVS